MAIVGVRKSFYAKYSKGTDGEYGYSGGGAFAKMVNISVSAESNDAELYSDDGLEESDYSFVKGVVKVTASDLEDGPRADILGITKTEDGELVYGDNIEPEVGFGFVITKKKAGVFSYRAIVLTRVKFKTPEDAAATLAGKLSFQNQNIEGTCSRDHSEKRNWKREQTFKTEAEAVAYIKGLLNITTTQAATTQE